MREVTISRPTQLSIRNSTVQCIFLAWLTPQELPFSMAHLIPSKNYWIAGPDGHDSLSSPATHRPLLSALYFHGLTNCFSRNPFALKNICVAPGCHPQDLPTSIFRDIQDLQRIKSFVFRLLRALCRRQRSHLQWNQQLRASLGKTPGGWGGPTPKEEGLEIGVWPARSADPHRKCG